MIMMFMIYDSTRETTQKLTSTTAQSPLPEIESRVNQKLHDQINQRVQNT